MEVINGIHQIKSPLRLPSMEGIAGYINIYVIEGSEGNIMIDSGWDSQESLLALREGLKAERLKLQDIKWVVVTHVHPDHYGLAGKIRQICGAKVAIHRLDAELIDLRYVNFTELVKELEEMLRLNGVPEEELPQLKEASLWAKQFVTPEPPEIMLEDGDKISNGSFEIEVVLTPGHSPGHICLYEPRRKLLFSGDHVLYDTTPHVGAHPQSGDNPLGDYISSLQRVERLKVKFVLPGHGPVFNSLGLRVEELFQHHEQRKRDIMRALGDELKTAYQVAQEIRWMPDQGGVAFQSLSTWDKRMAVTETIAHLKLLMVEGKVGSADMGGATLYLTKD